MATQPPTPTPSTVVAPSSRPPSRDPTALSSWGRAIARALEARGCEAASLLKRAGLDIAALDDPEGRYSLKATSELWRLAVKETGDPSFGLFVARHTSPTTFHALGFSLAASSTLREAFERIARYYRLVSEGATVRFAEDGDAYRISVKPAGPYVAVEAMDAMLALAVRLCRSLSDRTFAPLRVLVHRPAPADRSPFERCFRAPIEFDAPVHALVVDKAVCDRKLQGANAELARTNDLIAAQALGRLDQSRVADRVRVILINRLPGGAPSLGQMARELATSARELQRRLAKESTTYAELVDDTRRDLAEGYLREGRHAMSDIAYLLGFSGSASFTRAFRRWRGLPPSAYRPG